MASRNGVTTITVRGNVTEAIGALDALGIKAEETAAKTDAAFNGGGKHGGTGGLANFGKIVSVGLVGIGVASVKMAGDFQQSMTQLVTGAGESESAIGKVSKGILALAPQVGESTKQLASAMYLIESAGFHGADGLLVLKAAAEGAKVGNADMASVANAVTSVLHDYGLKASDAATVTSQLVATTAAGKMHMQDLADSLAAVLPIADKAHINFAQVGGALATMTVSGMSAQQASQDLANMIRSLQAPSQVAKNEMAQLGLNANTVSMNMGRDGLTGTLETLTKAITEHMGPAGTVLFDAMNQSMGAAKDIRIELDKMPPSLRELAIRFMEGSVSGKQFRTETKALPANLAAMASGFVNTYNQSHKFNQLLTSGSPAAQTYNAALEKMTGGATGLNTALMLTGDSAATFHNNVVSVSKATVDAKGNVEGWSKVQKDFNQKLDQAKSSAEVLGIKIGNVLIPIVEKMIGWVQVAVTWFGKHKTAAEVLAGVITTVLGAAVFAFTTNKIVNMIKGIGDAIKTFGRMGSAMAQLAVKIGVQAGIIDADIGGIAATTTAAEGTMAGASAGMVGSIGAIGAAAAAAIPLAVGLYGAFQLFTQGGKPTNGADVAENPMALALMQSGMSAGQAAAWLTQHPGMSFPASMSAPGWGQAMANFNFGGGKAIGGPVRSGTSYIVGEHGPEWFTPDTNGHITPHGKSASTTYYVEQHIYLPTGTPEEFARETTWQLGRLIQ